MKNFSILALIIIIGSLFIFPMFVFAAWIGPTDSPPNKNEAKPVNVSADPQVKTGILWIGGTGSSGAAPALRVQGENVSGNLLMHLISDNNSNMEGLKIDTDGEASDIPFRIRTDSSGGAAVNDADTKFIVEGAGNVGIGTTNPGSELDIYGSGAVLDLNSGTITQVGDPVDNSDGMSLLFADQRYARSYEALPAGSFGQTLRHDGTIWATTTNLYNNGTNIGIGTTNPQNSRLYVYEDQSTQTANIPLVSLYAGGSAAATKGGVLHVSSRRGVGTDDTNIFLVQGGSASLSPYLSVRNTGNIGIGTNGPDQKLHVYNSGAVRLKIESNTDNAFLDIDSNTDGGGGEESGIHFLDNSANKWEVYKASDNNFKIHDYTRGQTVFEVEDNGNMFLMENGGNVGIGVDPSYPLHVSGNAGAADPLATMYINAVTNHGGIVINNAASQQSHLRFSNNGSLRWQIRSPFHDATNPDSLRFYSWQTTSDVMTLKNNGNVGIGTIDPQTRFHSVGSQASFTNGQGQDEGIFLMPENSSNQNAGGRIFFKENSDNGYGFSIGYNGTTANTILNWPSNYFVISRHNNNSTGEIAMVIERSTGEIGIGTASPDATLHVEGDAKVTGELELGGSDVAEEFITNKIYPAGTVLVMDDKGYKSAKASNKEYDTSVIGVVSDNASLVMGKVKTDKKAIVAMVGVVKVKVNNSNGQIRKGDLLTTSNIYGQAMLASNPKIGTVIGKALENLYGESGEVMALVNLQ